MTTFKSIYVVDDAKDYRVLLQTIFSKYLSQYPLRLFESGDLLTHHLFRGLEQPGLILLDRHMPGRDGRRTLETLKHHPDWQLVPVVMMSSDTYPEEIQACYRCGANSFLRKPVELADLTQLLAATCQYWLELNQR